jgi:hypothetical protein
MATAASIEFAMGRVPWCKCGYGDSIINSMSDIAAMMLGLGG